MLRAASAETGLSNCHSCSSSGSDCLVSEPTEVFEEDVRIFEKSEQPDTEKKSIGIDQPEILRQLKVGQSIWWRMESMLK